MTSSMELVSARIFSSRLPLYSAPSLGANGTKCLIVESASSSKQSAIPSQAPTPGNYSLVGNIGDTWGIKKSPDQAWRFLDGG